jgi:D-alanine-D-alanine ligase
MEKPLAKARVERFGVPIATGKIWRTGTEKPDLPFPYVAKPCNGGSSVGFSVINNEKELAMLPPDAEWLCEHYLPGKEYSVAVLEGRALPPIEIRPQGGLYDYAHKYRPGATLELCPAPISPSWLVQLQNLALICFSALELRDFARVDFKEDAQGTPCFLEANSLPGMTRTSLFPLAARAAGLPMPDLCEKMARCAASRKG